MENKEVYCDVLTLLEQTIDKCIDNTILSAVDENDEYTVAAYKLLNEYGISGRKAIDFLYKFDALNKMFNGNKNKEEEPECN